jgi:hypothetical protein
VKISGPEDSHKAAFSPGFVEKGHVAVNLYSHSRPPVAFGSPQGAKYQLQRAIVRPGILRILSTQYVLLLLSP